MDHDLIVVVSVETERLLMTVAGDLTGNRPRALLNAAETVHRSHRANRHIDDVVIDVRRVREADAAGVRVLADTRHRLASHGLRVRVQGASSPLRALLEGAR